MGLAFSLAEALNIGWDLAAGGGAASIRDKLAEVGFRRAVVVELMQSGFKVYPSSTRRVIASKEFTDWLSAGGTSPLDEHLNDEQLVMLGVSNETTAAELGEAIGRALAAVAFDLADPVQTETFRRIGDLDEPALGTFNYAKDTWEFLTDGTHAGFGVFPVRWNERPVTNFFTGRRNDLEAIETAIGRSSTTVVTQLVWGLGGVGKTQLLAKFSSVHRDAFDLLAWFDASKEISPQLIGLAHQVGIIGADKDLAGLMLAWLRSTNRQCLVILDNVEEPAILAGFQSTDTVRLIATTRLSTLGGYGEMLKLGVFTRHEVRRYLQSRTTMTASDAERVGVALGNLPLALAHAAAYCSTNGTTADGYLSLLEGLPSPEFYSDNLDEFYLRVVYETWNTSIQHVSALAVRMLEVAAWLHPDAIPVEAFYSLVGNTRAGEADVDARHHESRALRQAGGELATWSLAEWTVEFELVVHRLVQRVVRDTKASQEARRHAVGFVVEATQFDVQQRGSWTLAQKIAPHLSALMECPCAIDDAGAELVEASNRCLQAFHYGGRPTESVRLANTASTYAEHVLGGGHPSTLVAWGNLAASYLSAGRTDEAIALGERVANQSHALLGAGHSSTLVAWGNLALSYQKAGRINEAITIDERITKQSEELLGAEHSATLTRRSNLASSYRTAGRTNEAVTIGEWVANRSEELLGAEHPSTLLAWGNLALSYQQAGRINEAITLGEQVTKQSERLLGSEHPTTLAAWSILASSYPEAGRNEEAIIISERITKQSEKLLGAKHPDTLTRRSNLASSYRTAGRTNEAITIDERITKQSDELLGAKHPETLAKWVNLASSYRTAGRINEAITLGEQVTKQSEEFLGANHPTTLVAWGNLALSYRAVGRTDEAMALLKLTAASMDDQGNSDTQTRTLARMKERIAEWQRQDS